MEANLDSLNSSDLKCLTKGEGWIRTSERWTQEKYLYSKIRFSIFF